MSIDPAEIREALPKDRDEIAEASHTEIRETLCLGK